MHLLRCCRNIALLVAALFTVPVMAGCSAATGTDDDLTSGICPGDASCPIGQECAGNGCVSVRPTLFDHIQLASTLFRQYNNDAEKAWRATHADLLIGQNITESLNLRGANPNVRLVSYFTNRYHLLSVEADEWCAAHGADPEDFYLHYREDVQLPGYTTVLVPGYPPGFVPGWNPNAQPGDPPASAASRSESRAFGLYDLQHEPWLLANFCHPDYREFAKDYIRRLVDGTVFGPNGDPEPMDGVLMDHGVFYPEFNEGALTKTEEFYGIPLDDNHPYAEAFETFYPELEQYLRNVFRKGIDVIPNYGHVYFLSRPDPISQGVQNAVDWVWGEVWLTHRTGSAPITGSNRVVTYDNDYEGGVAAIARQSLAGERRIVGARDLTNGSLGTDAGRIFTLAVYYLIANPNTFFAYETVQTHRFTGDLDQWQWNPAVAYDIGQPVMNPPGVADFDGRYGTKQHYVLAEGPDPYNPALTYRVLARRFLYGIVLVKMLPEGSVTDDRSITTHDLGRTYRQLLGDGSVSTLVSVATLHNNEAVILVDP